MEKLKYFAGGEWLESKSGAYMDVYNPSTGEVIAQAPNCLESEIEEVIQIAHKAFLSWSDVPPMRRVQVLYKFRDLVNEHMDELTMLVARENGKAWTEAQGDVLKVKEVAEHACGIPSLMMGESLMDASKGYDTVLYRESVGVFAGICPFNFPAMIPMGWMAPLCIATGNTMILKASSSTPMTSLRIAQLWADAGLPAGVLNVLTCKSSQSEILLKHPLVKGVTFVGSTKVGKHIYEVGAAHGKRVQALTEAKNHGLVLDDAPIARTAAGIINASFGCAGQRCMALPVIVAQESIADELVAQLVKMAKQIKIGPAYDQSVGMGPLVNQARFDAVNKWIEKGLEEGAKLVMDGRGVKVEGYENGFYIGPTIFDHVEPGMTVGDIEIFGPVLCIKRVKDFDEGLALMNDSAFGNGAVIFTQNGYYSRQFARYSGAGMIGINVGIPVPVGIFPFTGHKNSFFSDLHCLGKDGIRFYTETKTVTSRWFDEHEIKKEKVDTWDGTIG
ncbi:MAG: CoA-acylating methylmalonate-semialdehyde dehydrogenase [Clostridiaceae bacterium]|nr:CoA-acylating methylmalonate-semialdehyde dehydrogenase [Clostridiaceae bacterium]